MPISDFQKKRYKLVPGADYSDGPISKYGTFGNMLRNKIRTAPNDFANEAKTWALRMSGASPGLAQHIQDNPKDYTIDASGNPMYIGKTPYKGETKGSRLDTISALINNFEPGSIRFVKGLSSLKKTRTAKDLWANDKRFKQGVTDHVNAKDRDLFEKNERGYFDDISGQIKPTHNAENLEPIFRGVRLEPGNEYQKLNVGDYISSNQVESFSWDRKVAERFSEVPHAESPKTDRYLFSLVDRQSGIDLPKLSGHNAWGEAEVAMPANAKYEIIDKFKEDDVTHMFLGEVQTIPSGSKYHLREQDTTDFTDIREVKLAIEFAQERVNKYKDKIPTIAKAYGETVTRLKQGLAASEAAQ